MFIDIGKLDKSSWVIKESLLGLNAYAMPLEACMLVYAILTRHLHDV